MARCRTFRERPMVPKTSFGGRLPRSRSVFCRGGAPMGRPVVHFEIGCCDSKKIEEFYTQMCGWNITEAAPAAMIGPVAPGIGGKTLVRPVEIPTGTFAWIE